MSALLRRRCAGGLETRPARPPSDRPCGVDRHDEDERTVDLRSSFLFGQILLTPGIAASPDATRAAVMDKVQTFDAFTPDNDPYGEHDFSAFTQQGAGKIFWKIDYYDLSLTGGNENPADVRKTLATKSPNALPPIWSPRFWRGL